MYRWDIPYSDIAVLYRTNLEPRLLMERLMEYNIPFQMRDALPNIYEHWITQDLLTYIRMAADPLAEQHQAKRADALRIINRPKRYISREALDGADHFLGQCEILVQGEGLDGGADRGSGV